jgi:hypothetical protein
MGEEKRTLEFSQDEMRFPAVGLRTWCLLTRQSRHSPRVSRDTLRFESLLLSLLLAAVMIFQLHTEILSIKITFLVKLLVIAGNSTAHDAHLKEATSMFKNAILQLEGTSLSFPLLR